MKKTKTTPYDVVEHLRTPEEMAAYLEACIEEANGDVTFIAKALDDIARAKGIAQVALPPKPNSRHSASSQGRDTKCSEYRL